MILNVSSRLFRASLYCLTSLGEYKTEQTDKVTFLSTKSKEIAQFPEPNARRRTLAHKKEAGDKLPLSIHSDIFKTPTIWLLIMQTNMSLPSPQTIFDPFVKNILLQLRNTSPAFHSILAL